MKQGLLYLSQESCLIGDVSYHNYQGLLVEKDEWESLARDLGVHNKVMMLRNHGAICCGETIEEAFYYAYHLVLACDAQLKMVRYYYDISLSINLEICSSLDFSSSPYSNIESTIAITLFCQTNLRQDIKEKATKNF